MERASCIINYKFGYKRSPSSVTILFFLSLLFATQFQFQFSKSYPYCSLLLHFLRSFLQTKSSSHRWEKPRMMVVLTNRDLHRTVMRSSCPSGSEASSSMTPYPQPQGYNSSGPGVGVMCNAVAEHALYPEVPGGNPLIVRPPPWQPKRVARFRNISSWCRSFQKTMTMIVHPSS